MMGPTGCAETSARNYKYSLRNSPEERSSHLLRAERFKLSTIDYDRHALMLSIINTYYRLPVLSSMTVKHYSTSRLLISNVIDYYTSSVTVKFIVTRQSRAKFLLSIITDYINRQLQSSRIATRYSKPLFIGVPLFLQQKKREAHLSVCCHLVGCPVFNPRLFVLQPDKNGYQFITVSRKP
jgi:hypothetical protein